MRPSGDRFGFLPFARTVCVFAGGLLLFACATTMHPRPSWVTSRWHSCEEWVAEASCGHPRHRVRPFVGPEGVSFPTEEVSDPIPKPGPEVEMCLDELAAQYLELPAESQGNWLEEKGCPADVHGRYGPLKK